MVDTNDEWIVQRTGIRERRIAGEGESTATLATAAARKALDAAGLKPADLDLIIVATITPEMVFPSTACFVAAALGLNSTPAFDMSAACSGFIYALNTGANFIKAGQYKTVMVIGAETLSAHHRLHRPAQAASSSATAPAPRSSNVPTTRGRVSSTPASTPTAMVPKP